MPWPLQPVWTQLNGKKSQAELARELGVTRALVSHYVVGFADLLGIEVTKFRKSERFQEVFREAQLKRRRGA
jgi:predicted transcriptional regulator